ncbi:quinolinate synthase NadA [Salinisphaera sp. USBA-960]|uniref:quinolinate synthase NadA n=1 Tax=Salinisphaera orenii TaxID=856731 RepID=UPI000DBE6227|nr:quinolinate synthase NadA [Salifodinibacter halophilus]NNC26878.1 quinolinate synthase NadA [Salifodinibacter halophilus]
MTDFETLRDEINQLRSDKNAVILAHNYERPEIQDISDYLGDSLGLSRQAAATDADVIVFCGVHFMAETASITSPDKTVLIPDLNAGCSLAESITVDELKNWKAEHPDATVVTYINTSAAIKAECDYCVTSSNAVKVIESIPEDEPILFLPDKFLGTYVEMMTGRKLHIWPGACHVHEKIGDMNLAEKQESYPNAEMLIHPECGCSTACMMNSAMNFDCASAHIHSTSGMLTRAEQSEADEFVVATETGILHQLRQRNPGKTFHAADDNSVCEYMKMTTLPKLRDALKHTQFQIRVDPELAAAARQPIDRMLAVG